MELLPSDFEKRSKKAYNEWVKRTVAYFKGHVDEKDVKAFSFIAWNEGATFGIEECTRLVAEKVDEQKPRDKSEIKRLNVLKGKPMFEGIEDE